MNGLKAAQREEGGATRLSIGIQESQCLKTARAREVCPAREGAKERRCQATLKEGRVRDLACEAAAITLCDGCDEAEVGLAKLAVKKITNQWPSKQWALQHLAAAKKQVRPKYFQFSSHHTNNTFSPLRVSKSFSGGRRKVCEAQAATSYV